jgi:hypothetical protein
MPEQVQSASFDQVLPGKAHNVAGHCAIGGFVAMHVAILAHWFFNKGTVQTTFEGI